MEECIDDAEAFCSRIREVTDIIGNPNAAAKKAGVTPSSVARWLKGESDPSRTNLIRMAEAAGVNVAWLATGEGAKFKAETADSDHSAEKTASKTAVDTLGNLVDVEEFVFIPRYSAKAAAGHGYPGNDDKPLFSMAFRKYWIKNYLGADPKDLSVITVKGDSMEGVLNDGDAILVNHAKTSPGNGLYVVCIGDNLIVKRVQTLPGGKLLISSANEAYAPFEISIAEEGSDVKIMGKVEWFGRQI